MGGWEHFFVSVVHVGGVCCAPFADGDGAANFFIKLNMLIRMTVSSAGNCNFEKHSFILIAFPIPSCGLLMRGS